ncbi:MAG: thioesterase family protein [Gammaproteobacteria bacterium]|nr:thioesterase family protein [Gammaproteobacteria bacterium]
MKVLDDYPVVIELPVVWGEMDSFSHVNNIIYFRYFESARLAYVEQTGLLEYMDKTGIGPILAHTECRFKLPLSYPDTISVGASITELKEDRFKMLYAIASHATGKIAAEGSGTIVCFDYKNNCKATLPDEVRDRIERIQSR